MNGFEDELRLRLERVRDEGLHRELRRVDSPQGTRVVVDGRSLLNFSSNDYLGLANHPTLVSAALKAVRDFGAGSGASRLICGSLGIHHQLEETLAGFKGVEAALVFSSGYAAATGTLTALVGRDDVVVVDKRVHACVVDGARLSGAKLRVFAHNDLNELEDILRWADERQAGLKPAAIAARPRTLIVTESVFSMDGDQAPLRELVSLKERYGAWLMVDEAHATGVFGPRRRGLAEALGVAGQIEVQMGTLGKALGAAGGYIAGSRVLIEWLVNRARSFIFSTAPVPAAAAAARAAVELVDSAAGADLVAGLWRNVAAVRAVCPVVLPEATGPILSLILGDEARAMRAAAGLRDRGVFVPAVRFPTVPRGSARLRLTVTAAHTPTEIAALGASWPGLIEG